MTGEPTAAGEAPRMRLAGNGIWHGRPRIPADTSNHMDMVSVYPSNPGEAQVSFTTGSGTWSLAVYSRPEQLREFAALLTEAANLIDMLALVERSAADPECADSTIVAAEVTT